VRGYKEEGTITTAFDMTVQNNMDRFDLVMDVIERVGIAGDSAVQLRQLMEKKLIEHAEYIKLHGIDMPEIRNWEWNAGLRNA
jgi:xylulose-5-phosphate/fructose-6-phosphate phosphoketolase